MSFIKPITQLGAALALSALISAPASAQETEGRELAEAVFASIDLDGDGFANQGDMEQFRDLVFTSMDADENEIISFDEFSAWDPGFQQVADAEGRPEALLIAGRIVFGLWDRDANGELTPSEMRKSVLDDFTRADTDGDYQLSEKEYLRNFLIIAALRAAIRPDIEVE